MTLSLCIAFFVCMQQGSVLFFHSFFPPKLMTSIQNDEGFEAEQMSNLLI